MSGASPRRNQLQEEQRARTRASITAASLKVFSELGYYGSSIEHILLRAGVSRAAFYSHFDGKLAVVRMIAEDFEPAWRPTFHYLARLRDPGLPELTEWASRHLEFHRSNREACALLSQVIALEEELYWQISAQRDALIRMLAAHHRAFAAAMIDPDVMLEARILLGNVDQICFHVARNHLPDPGGATARIIAARMLNFFENHGDRETPSNDRWKLPSTFGR